MDQHRSFMQQCIELGKGAIQYGNSPIVAIVVKNNQIIGRGIEAFTAPQDITKHAEIEAVKNAMKSLTTNSLKGCTLYITHQPCIKSSFAMRHYNLDNLVYGSKIIHPTAFSTNIKKMLSKKLPKWGKPPVVIDGILEEICDKLFDGYTYKYA